MVSPMPRISNEEERLATWLNHLIESLHAAAQKADEQQKSAILQSISEYVAQNPGSLGELIDLLKSEADSQLLVALGKMVLSSGAPENRELLTAVALNCVLSDDTTERRQASLEILANIPEPTADLQQAVARVSRDDPENEIRLAAIETLGTWLCRHPDRMQNLAEEMFDTIRSSDDALLRGVALRAFSRQNAPLPENIVIVLAQFLKTDPGAENRAWAAQSLGKAGENARQTAIYNLRNAYLSETDLETKRMILKQIVRLAPAASPEILKQLPVNEPLLAQDARDYLEILSSGLSDPEQITDEKNLRDAKRGTKLGATRQN